jgi:hypothetical protein
MTAADRSARQRLTTRFTPIAVEFTALTHRPEPLALDCTRWADLGLPARVVDLYELREWIMSHRWAVAAHNAIWQEVIGYARTDQRWMTGALGLALPGLRALAGDLTRGWRGDPADIEQEIICAFIRAIHTDIEPVRGSIYIALRKEAERAATAIKYTDSRYVPVANLEQLCGAAPRVPWQHPDLIVGRAVDLGILEHSDAVVFVCTRLDRIPIEYLADALDVDVDVLRQRRTRAKQALAAALADGTLSAAISTTSRDHLRKRAATSAAIRTALAA